MGEPAWAPCCGPRAGPQHRCAVVQRLPPAGALPARADSLCCVHLHWHALHRCPTPLPLSLLPPQYIYECVGLVDAVVAASRRSGRSSTCAAPPPCRRHAPEAAFAAWARPAPACSPLCRRCCLQPLPPSGAPRHRGNTSVLPESILAGMARTPTPRQTRRCASSRPPWACSPPPSCSPWQTTAPATPCTGDEGRPACLLVWVGQNCPTSREGALNAFSEGCLAWQGQRQQTCIGRAAFANSARPRVTPCGPPTASIQGGATVEAPRSPACPLHAVLPSCCAGRTPACRPSPPLPP